VFFNVEQEIEVPSFEVIVKMVVDTLNSMKVKTCSFFVAFFSATIDGRNLMFGHKLHIGTPYCGKRFFTR
jgi:hypothetical protein